MIIDIHAHVTAPDSLYVYKSGLLSHRGAHGRGAVNATDDLFIAQRGRIRRVNGVSNIITTVVGNGNYGSSGDDGPATQARIRWPFAIATDTMGDLFFTDYEDGRVRKVNGRTGIHRCSVKAGMLR